MPKEAKELTNEDKYFLTGQAIYFNSNPYFRFTGEFPPGTMKEVVDGCLVVTDFRLGLRYLTGVLGEFWAMQQTTNESLKEALSTQMTSLMRWNFSREGLFTTPRELLEQGKIDRPDNPKPLTLHRAQKLGLIVHVLHRRQEIWKGNQTMAVVEPMRWEDDGGR